MAAKTLEELPACPVETTLSLIGSKWQVLILRDLFLNGTMRFKELQRSVGAVSQKVLTQNLRAMEESGIVHREVFAEVPPRVEYSLTRNRPDPEARDRRHVGLGRRLQKAPPQRLGASRWLTKALGGCKPNRWQWG